MNEDILAKEDVTLEPLPGEQCAECDSAPATHWIQVDLGFMTTTLTNQSFCKPCGEEFLQRVRDLLPERIEP